MKKHLLSIYCLLVVCSLFAQKNKNAGNTVIIPCSDFHITKPLSEIFANNPVDKTALKKVESEDRENRRSPKFPKTVEKDGPLFGNDPTTIQNAMGVVSQNRAPIQSWAGQSNGSLPLDPSGAAGPNHYVQIVNATSFRVYDKTGTILLTGSLGSLWVPAVLNEGDPLVLYDKAADRWIMSQFGYTGNKIYIAISQTNDPTGAYYTYTYTSPNFPDYLKFSVWQDGYYMTSNQGAQNIFCFDRSAMLAGIPTARSLYKFFSPPHTSNWFLPLTADAGDGTLAPAGTPCPIFSFSDNGWGGSFTDAVNIYQMAVDWAPATPTATITLAGNIPTAAFDASYASNFNDCPQPGTTQKLDGIGGVLNFRAQWKTWNGYNSVVLNWAVKISSTQRSIKWCELRQDQTTGVWSMYQEGIYAPDAATRWLGSIAMDNNGSIALCYLKSDTSSIYPSLCYTGRTANDPLGILPIAEVVAQAGSGSQTTSERIGDYSETWLDPDGVTFWHTGEYIGASGVAKTQIYSFQIPIVAPAASVSVTSSATTICAGTSVIFIASPINGGATPVYQWQINGVAVGNNSAAYSTTLLTNNDTVICVMTSSLTGATNNPAISSPIIITVNSDCVWPGDANNDSLVNNFDLLPIGLFYSQTGSPRASISNTWQSYPAANWGAQQTNGYDVKHVDCNGDGIIDNNDTLAINLNYNLVHAIASANLNNERTLNSDIYLVTSSNYNAGDSVDAEVWAGNITTPVTNLYGIAFNINYDVSLVQTGTEHITYPTNSWLGTPGTNAITISKTDALAAKAYGGITRVDHTNASGSGKIADFKFQAKTSITSTSVLHLFVSGYMANDVNGASLLFNTPADSITIIPLGMGVTNTNTNSGFSISPNPFNQQTTIAFNEIQKNTTIRIMDVLGKEIKTAILNGGKNLIIEKGEMQRGIYIVQVTDANKNVVNKKIIVQ